MSHSLFAFYQRRTAFYDLIFAFLNSGLCWILFSWWVIKDFTKHFFLWWWTFVWSYRCHIYVVLQKKSSPPRKNSNKGYYCENTYWKPTGLFRIHHSFHFSVPILYFRNLNKIKTTLTPVCFVFLFIQYYFLVMLLFIIWWPIIF